MSNATHSAADANQLVAIWGEAVASYKQDSGDKLELLTDVDSVEKAFSLINRSHAQFEAYHKSGAQIRKFLTPLLHFVLACTATVKDGAKLGLRPAEVILSAIQWLMMAAQGVGESYDTILELFKRIEHFLNRLKVYTHHEICDEVRVIIVPMLAQIIKLLGLASKEIARGRARAFLKKLRGGTDEIKEISASFDSFAEEEHRMLVSLLYDESRTAKLDQIRKFLNYPHPKGAHETARKHHKHKTGAWLLNSNIYHQWVASEGTTMWIHGPPGTGKTMLFSTVVADLQAQHHISNMFKTSNNYGVAYFYCTISEQSTLTSNNIIGSLLMQLAYQRPSIPESVTELYVTREEGPPTTDNLASALKEVILLFTHTYILIDGLDECSEETKSELPSIFTDISTGAQHHLHLLVVSRPDMYLALHAGSLNPLHYKLDLCSEPGVCEDIISYVHNALVSEDCFLSWHTDLRIMVEEALTMKADRMFLWVHCQLNTLKRCVSQAQITDTLNNLPRDLATTYNRILASIPDQHATDMAVILQWLSFAQRPMKLAELCVLMTVDLSSTETPHIAPERRPLHPSLLVEMCFNLVTWDSQTDIVQFSHASVKDYLQNQQVFPDKFPTISPIVPRTSEHFLTSSCLVYILETKLVYPFTPEQLSTRDYAMHYWYKHLCKGGFDLLDAPLPSLLRNFLNVYWPRDMPTFHSPGITWIKWSDYQITSLFQHVPTGDMAEPNRVLHLAVDKQFPLLLEWSIQQGADVHYIESGMTPLEHLFQEWNYKISGRDTDILQACAQVLFSHGVDPNDCSNGTYTPLLCSAQGNASHKLKFATFLLESGADTEYRGPDGTALQVAAQHQSLDMMKLLLKWNADVNACQHPRGSALHWAAYLWNKKMIVHLLENKADVNIQSTERGTPLLGALMGVKRWTAQKGRKKCLDTVGLLLQHGAHTNTVHPEKGTPLDYVQCQLGTEHADPQVQHFWQNIAQALTAHGAVTSADLENRTRDDSPPEHGRDMVDRFRSDSSGITAGDIPTMAVHESSLLATDDRAETQAACETGPSVNIIASGSSLHEKRPYRRCPAVSREAISTLLVLLVGFLIGNIWGGFLPTTNR